VKTRKRERNKKRERGGVEETFEYIF